MLGVQLPQGQGPPATGLIGTLAAGLVDIVACRGATRVLQKRKCSQQEGGQSKGLWRQLWGPDRGLEVWGGGDDIMASRGRRQCVMCLCPKPSSCVRCLALPHQCTRSSLEYPCPLAAHPVLQALAVMFVWVAVGGVMGAVERLDVAGTKLLGTAAHTPARTPGAAGAGAAAADGTIKRTSLIFNRQPSRMSLEAQHIQQHGDVSDEEEQHQQQPQHQQDAGFLPRLSSGFRPQMGRSSSTTAGGQNTLSGPHDAALPHHQPPPRAASLNEETVAVAAGVTAAQQRRQQQPLWRRAAAEVLPHVLLLAVLWNMVGFWRGKLQQLAGLCCTVATGKGAGGNKAPQHG